MFASGSRIRAAARDQFAMTMDSLAGVLIHHEIGCASAVTPQTPAGLSASRQNRPIVVPTVGAARITCFQRITSVPRPALLGGQRLAYEE